MDRPERKVAPDVLVGLSVALTLAVVVQFFLIWRIEWFHGAEGALYLRLLAILVTNSCGALVSGVAALVSRRKWVWLLFAPHAVLLALGAFACLYG